MRVEGNEIVLSEHIMLNSRNDLIYNNGDPVIEKSKDKKKIFFRLKRDNANNSLV